MSNTFDKHTAQFVAVLAQNVPALSGDEMQGWIQNPKALQKLLSGLSSSTAIGLVPLSQMNGVLMSGNANLLFNGILGTIQKTESDDLKKTLSDHEIIEKFGEGIIFESVDDLEVTIVDLVTKQPDGKKGALLNNGYANIFYVRVNGEVRYVYVRWDSGDRGWRVVLVRVHGRWWRAGRRVFCNCGPLDA